MDFLEKYKYHKDNPEEFGIDLKKFKKLNEELDTSHISALLSTSIRVSKDLIPSVAKAIDQVFKRIKIENNFNFFVTPNSLQANASCSLMSSASRPDIILTSKLVELFSEEELQFVIGHEIAHYVYQHGLYPNPNNAEENNFKLNILNLSRSAEISADRIGFLACNSLDHALRANLKLASGLGEKHIKFKFSSYLDQLRELEDLGNNSGELWSTHPNFLIRMQALIWFSMTKEYHEFFDTKKKGTYTLEEVDQKIENSIKKITGNELERSNKEIYERALLWGSLNIYLSDKKFSKQEQGIFAERFGKKAEKAISFLKFSNKDVLEKKVNDSFVEAANLLKSYKMDLSGELKKLASETDGDKTKKQNILSKMLEILSSKD
jgi:hypothetical protein